MLFNTSNIEEKGTMSYYITPSVSEVTILNIHGETPEGTNFQGNPRSPFLEVEMKLKGAEDKNSTRFRMYTSASMIEKTMKQITHMATRMVKKAQLDAVGGDNLTTEQYGQNLHNLLSGKSVRLQFNSEEYKNADQEVKTKPMIPNNTWFAEAIEEGAEHPVIPAAISKLKYSRDNVYQNRKIVEPGVVTATVGVTTEIEDIFNTK